MHHAIDKVLALKNIRVFENSRENVEVKVSKAEKVKAFYSYFDSEKGYDIRISPELVSQSGKKYQKVVMSISSDGERSFFNGLVNPVRKEGSKVKLTGTLDVDGQKVKIFIKEKSAGNYFPVSFSKEAAKVTEPQPLVPEDSSVPF